MKKTLYSVLLIPSLLLSLFMNGCADKTPEQSTEEKPIYSGCIVLLETGDNYYSLGYEIHLDREANMIIDPPDKLFQDVIQPEDWAGVIINHSADDLGSYCKSEEYPIDWFYSQMDIIWNKEDIPDLVKKLESLPINVSFEDRETGESFSYEYLLPVIVQFAEPEQHAFDKVNQYDLFFEDNAYVCCADDEYLYIVLSAPIEPSGEFTCTKEIHRLNTLTGEAEGWRTFDKEDCVENCLVIDGNLVYTEVIPVQPGEDDAPILVPYEYRLIYEDNDGKKKIVDSGTVISLEQLPVLKRYENTLVYRNYQYISTDGNTLFCNCETIQYDLSANTRTVLHREERESEADFNVLLSVIEHNYGLNGELLTLITRDDNEETDLVEINLNTRDETVYHLPVYADNALSLSNVILIEYAEFVPADGNKKTALIHSGEYDKTNGEFTTKTTLFLQKPAVYKDLVFGTVNNAVQYLDTDDMIQHKLISYSRIPVSYVIGDSLFTVIYDAAEAEGKRFNIHIEEYEIKE
ncbi:MAG: hypothetical protein E7188_01380 [Erysipelotrichaceae bacterium]|nr:hypothetical protein [Erysipelotrichaceae bacterium]